MKKRFAIFLFVILAIGLCVPPAFAQASGSVKGVCKDAQGNPIVDGYVVWANTDNGQKYPLKTNKKGQYFSLGISPGKYNVTLYKTQDDMKAAKEMDHVNGFQVQLDENSLDFDVKKEQENAAKGQGLTPEQLKQMQEAQAKQAKETNTVKALNDKLNAAKAAADAGDYDTAIAAMNDANQMDPSRDLIWFKLGDYYRLSAPKQTDPAEKQKRLDSAVESYQKAVQLKQATTNDKDPNAAKNLAAYYNNLADALNKARKTDEAVKNYEQAAQIDPTAAGQSYFNIGAVYTNAGRVDEALVAFDKVIAADPNRAEAYYWKGVNLIGKATLQGDKMIAPPGTAEAFQKYLELQPTGTYADAAKQMLTSIGSSVETSFGNKKKATPKK
ncbi:MAG TPA: tetratricopeptide repeat protein [Candidatus Dormibacteraeota bacterium]|nr:tetratricopeptide repeat protein [Candidatus Dormibacteraeota bacterium]